MDTKSQLEELQHFDKTKLKHVKTEVKAPLPTKEGNSILCTSLENCFIIAHKFVIFMISSDSLAKSA